MDRIKQKLDMSEKEFEKVCILHCLISAREFDCWASTRGVVVSTRGVVITMHACLSSLETRVPILGRTSTQALEIIEEKELPLHWHQ
jgi:hypothetical protein